MASTCSNQQQKNVAAYEKQIEIKQRIVIYTSILEGKYLVMNYVTC